MPTFFEPRCKVCNSSHRKTYEQLYYDSQGKIAWTELQRKAKVYGEEISRRAFERHFTKHFSNEVATLMESEADVQDVVTEAKKEVVDIVKEIKENLGGLKQLLNKTLELSEDKLTPQILRVLTDIYREHRQSLEACEKLTSKLTSETTLSEAEILKMLYEFAKDFCPQCTLKFKKNLDEYLRRRKK